MHYVDIGLSLVLFALGVLSFVLPRFRTNLWVSVLSLVMLPLALYSYYFTGYDPILFGNVSVQDVLLYPFVKVLLVLALAGYMRKRKPKSKPS